jgi:putative endonuclease
MPKQPAVYILPSKPTGALYIGIISNLAQRIWEHKNHLIEGFTQRYHIHRLDHFELFDGMYEVS